MSKHIDFGEDTNYRPSRKQRDSFGIGSWLLRHGIVQTPQSAANASKLIMLGVVIISLLVATLLLWNNNENVVPEEAYFDPTIHNANDEPL